MEKMVKALEKELKSIEAEISRTHEIREKILALARGINQNSREAIESIHSGNLEAAKKLIRSAKGLNYQMADILSDYPGLYHSVHFAQKELVEAVMFYVIYTNSAIPSRNSLRVMEVAYLNGLGEAIGELRRWMISSTGENNVGLVKEIFNWMNKIMAFIRPFIAFPDAVTANAKNTRDNMIKIHGANQRDFVAFLRDEEKRKREEKLIRLLSKK